jgi:protein gp37
MRIAPILNCASCDGTDKARAALYRPTDEQLFVTLVTMNSSTIEWTSATWNPVTGCTKVSPGCDHCYAETFAERWRGVVGHPYERGFDLQLRPERLSQPLNWRRPSRIFVNSMSDLFHAQVPENYIAEVFAVMGQASQHEFQVLTKRAERLERLARRLSVPGNVWLGVSVESPEYYGRIRHLARVDAGVRFLSCEPLLAPLPAIPLEGIHWVIVGGESGPCARPMEAAWVRDIQRQCARARVPFFFKQWGGVNKKRAGRALDGKEWNEMPVGRHGEGSPAHRYRPRDVYRTSIPAPAQRTRRAAQRDHVD